MTEITTRKNPYPGPVSFQIGETLYGRRREMRQLLNLLIAERIVLLYSPSGAGKTSLIQAALIPELEREGFRVFRPARVSLAAEEQVSGVTNRYIFSLLLSWEANLSDGTEPLPHSDLAAMTLAEYLALRTSQHTTAMDEAEDKSLVEETWAEEWHGDVLIFDQFEEILTVDPTDREAKHEFFRQVGEVLQDRQRWALFAMREEFVAGLDPYLRPIPTRFATTFRLELLGPDAARQAMQLPAKAQGVTFMDAAAEKLIDDLRRVQVMEADGSTHTALGDFVEPVQLQVVCLRLWNGLAADDNEIGIDDVNAFGDVDSALRAYYTETVDRIAQATDVGGRLLREWVNEQLITESGIRGQVLMGQDVTVGLENSAIWQLVDAHLVRAEKRRGATWFELAHDRLLEPVQEENEAWFAANLTPFQRQAAAWDRAGRSDGLVLHGAELYVLIEQYPPQGINMPRGQGSSRQSKLESLLQVLDEFSEFSHTSSAATIDRSILSDEENKAKNSVEKRQDSPNNWTQIEEEFYDRCVAAWLRAEQDARQRRRIRRLAIGATVVAVIAIVTAMWAWVERNRANTQTQIAQSRQLSVESTSSLANSEPATALRLGIEAGQAYATFEAFSAIRNAIVSQVSIVKQFDHSSDVEAIAWDAHKQQVVSVGKDRRIVRWDLTENRYVDQWTIPPELSNALSVAWNGDGTQLATGHESGELVIWSIDGRYTIYQAHEGGVKTVDWHPQQNLIVTGDTDGFVRIWSPVDLAPIDEFGIETAVNRAKWNADGNRIVIAGGDGSIHIWDKDEQREIVGVQVYAFGAYDIGWYGKSSQILSAGLIGFSASGVLTAAHLWNTIDNGSLTLPIQTFGGHSSLIQYTALNLTNNSQNPQNARLATGSDDGIIRIWDVQSGLLLNELHTDATLVSGLVWLSETELLSANSSGQMMRWSFEQTGELPLRNEYKNRVSVLQWLNGNLILSAAHDGQGHLWHATNGEIVMPIQHTGEIDDAQVHRNGSQLLTASADGTVGVWDLENYQEITRLGPGRGRYVYARWNNTNPPSLVMAGYWCNEVTCPDGSRYEIHMWRVDQILPGQSPEPDLILTGHNSNIQTARWNLTDFVAPAGTRMVTASYDGTIRIWDVALDSPTAGQTLQTLVHTVTPTATTALSSTTQIATSDMSRWVNEAKWNRAGSALLSYSNDQTARIWQWNPQTEQFVSMPPLAHDAAVVWADWVDNDQRVVTVSADGLGRVWNVQNSQLLHELAGHAGAIIGASWSNNAKEQLLTVSADTTAILWQISDGTLLRQFFGHSGPVSGALLNERADLLLTYSKDKTARLWQLSTGEQLAVLPGHTDEVMLVDWDRDRSRIVTGGMDGVVRQYYREMDDLLRAACEKLADSATVLGTVETANTESLCVEIN